MQEKRQDLQYKVIKEELADLIQKGKLGLFVGAGISRNAPSFLPLWSEMREFILTSVFGGYNSKTKQNLRHTLNQLRPEVVLQVLYGVLGRGALDILDVLKSGVPNIIHYFLAKCLSLGNGICTTNFDNLIELACANLGINFSVCANNSEIKKCDFSTNNILKIHGTLLDQNGKDCKKTIIATLEQVGKGLSTNKILALKKFMLHESLVFLGYSGLDNFDIIPILKNIDHSCQAIWIQHKNGSTPTIIGYQELRAKRNHDHIDEIILSYNNKSIIIEINTLKFIEELFKLIFCNYHEHFMKFEQNTSEYEKLRAAGRMLETAGKFSEAENEYQKALEIAKKSHDKSKQVLSGDDLAYLYGAQGEYKKALLTYQEIEKIADVKTDRARVLFGEGKAYRILGQLNKAFDKLNEAKKLFEEENNKKLTNSLSFDLGEIYALRAEYDKALSILRTRRDFFTKSGDIQQKIWSMAEIARIKAMKGNFETAKNILQKILNKYEDVTDKFSMGWVILWLADCKRLLNENKEATIDYMHAKDILNGIQDKGGLSSINVGLAEIERIEGNYDSAEKLYKEYLSYLQNSQRKLSYANSLLGLAENNRLSGNHTPNYEKPLKLYKEMGVIWGIVHANLGYYCYLLAEKDETALHKLNKATQLIEKYGFSYEKKLLSKIQKDGSCPLNFP